MGYFKDNKQNKSMTRLLVFMAAIVAYVICLSAVSAIIFFAWTSAPEITETLPDGTIRVTAAHHKEFAVGQITAIIMALLGYAGLKKVFQAKIENTL